MRVRINMITLEQLYQRYISPTFDNRWEVWAGGYKMGSYLRLGEALEAAAKFEKGGKDYLEWRKNYLTKDSLP